MALSTVAYSPVRDFDGVDVISVMVCDGDAVAPLCVNATPLNHGIRRPRR